MESIGRSQTLPERDLWCGRRSHEAGTGSLSSGLEIHPASWLAGREWPCRSAAAPAAFIHAMDARCSLAQLLCGSPPLPSLLIAVSIIQGTVRPSPILCAINLCFLTSATAVSISAATAATTDIEPGVCFACCCTARPPASCCMAPTTRKGESHRPGSS